MAVIRTDAAAAPSVPSIRIKAPARDEQEPRQRSTKAPERPSRDEEPKRQSRGDVDTRA